MITQTRFRAFLSTHPAVLFLVGAGISFAADGNLLASGQQNWPQWRGPLATGVAPSADPPITWAEDQNVRWKVKVPGSGTASPVVWENQVFVQTAIPTGKKSESPAIAEPAAPAGTGDRPRRGGRGEVPTEIYQFALLSLDRSTGKTQWQRIAREELPHEGHHRDHGFASHSPVTDGTRVYAYFGSRGLHCFDLKGNPQWQKELGDMQTRNGFGEGSSPLLANGIVVVNWDHQGEDFIVAMDAANGAEKWRQPREEDTSWSTPLMVAHGGQTQVVVAATSRIRSYDLHTGKQIWECGGLTANVIPTPVTDGSTVFTMSGFRGSALLAIRLGREGDLTDTDAIAWTLKKSTPYVPSPLLYGDQLYYLASNDALLSCAATADGKLLIDAERLPGAAGVYASPVGAAGRVYLVGRNGTSVVLKKSDSLEIMATNRLEDRFDASPAVVGRDLLLRGHEHLYCLSEN